MKQGMTLGQFVTERLARKGPPERVVSPYGIPGINSEDDAAFILAATRRGTRAMPEPKKPRQPSIAELRAEVVRLRARVADLERMP
jgi:hypothetical protein